jgi:CheY-like chemotaxis protein
MKKILIVEDQPEIRELIRLTLEFEDYEIAEAANGDAALQKLPNYQPNLVLLDVMMPGGIDGVELCRRIKSDPGLRRIKVIMLTAKSQAADRNAGLSAGADDYLVKPFSPLELMKTIMRVLR